VNKADVYYYKSDRLKPLCDNWSCEPFPEETKEDYYVRSKSESIKYITGYPIDTTGEIIFSITFTDQVV
jgi:hypothetical protein